MPAKVLTLLDLVGLVVDIDSNQIKPLKRNFTDQNLITGCSRIRCEDYMPRRHGEQSPPSPSSGAMIYFHGHFFSWICLSKSSRKYFSRALERFDGAGRKSTERIAWSKQFAVAFEILNITWFTGAFFERGQYFFEPGQSHRGRVCTSRRTRGQRISSDYAQTRRGKSCHRARSSSRCPGGCRPS